MLAQVATFARWPIPSQFARSQATKTNVIIQEIQCLILSLKLSTVENYKIAKFTTCQM
jgi:hypothetical protein